MHACVGDVPLAKALRSVVRRGCRQGPHRINHVRVCMIRFMTSFPQLFERSLKSCGVRLAPAFFFVGFWSASDTHTHTLHFHRPLPYPGVCFIDATACGVRLTPAFVFLFFERTRAGSAALHHTRQCVHAKAHTQHVFAQGTTSAIAAQCQPLLLSLVHDATCIMISQFRVPRECRYASRGTVYSNRQQLDRSTSSAYLVLY